jgi:hypothetical protein
MTAPQGGPLLPPGGTLRPVVDPAEQLAKDLEPGGRYATEGETLRYYDRELERLRGDGVPERALAQLVMHRDALVRHIARRVEVDRYLQPVQYVYELPRKG